MAIYITRKMLNDFARQEAKCGTILSLPRSCDLARPPQAATPGDGGT
ncbi:hypothetical protein [Sulfitobacter sp. W027]|nr:hypothetical protein [Sulfitobacter sp. W027]